MWSTVTERDTTEVVKMSGSLVYTCISFSVYHRNTILFLSKMEHLGDLDRTPEGSQVTGVKLLTTEYIYETENVRTLDGVRH